VLARLLRTTGTGEPHITLASGAVWHDPQTERDADQAAWRALAQAGSRGGGGLDRDLADSLAVLARPSVEYYGWFTHDDTTTAVLAAAINRDAVLAVRQQDRVRLTPADPRHLAEELIGCLPDVPPARGRSATLPVAKIRTELAPRPSRAGGRVLQAVGPVRGEMASFARLTHLPVTGAGELYAAVRDRRTGGRRTSPHPVGYQDTVEGRWLAQIVPGRDEDWAIIAPATPALLLTRVQEVHHALTLPWAPTRR
jgi:hypothetical protein